jgi:hypothetical protein
MRTAQGVDDALRLKIIEECLAGSSKSSLVRKYKLKAGTQSIRKWMRTFGITETEQHAVPAGLMKHQKEGQEPAEVQALKQEIKRLKTCLAHERMRADAYDTMIDLAEATYQIKVRKNSATKQS